MKNNGLNPNDFSDRELLKLIYTDMQIIKDELLALKAVIHSIPQWISITDVANDKGMSKESIRHRIINSGDYEIDKDYRYDGKRLVINKNIIHSLKRQRKAKVAK